MSANRRNASLSAAVKMIAITEGGNSPSLNDRDQKRRPTPQQARSASIFFKLMEERHHRRPTIITTNLDYDEWHGFLGNKSLVAALLSRVRERCHTIKIDGPSLRPQQG